MLTLLSLPGCWSKQFSFFLGFEQCQRKKLKQLCSLTELSITRRFLCTTFQLRLFGLYFKCDVCATRTLKLSSVPNLKESMTAPPSKPPRSEMSNCYQVAMHLKLDRGLTNRWYIFQDSDVVRQRCAFLDKRLPSNCLFWSQSGYCCVFLTQHNLALSFTLTISHSLY